MRKARLITMLALAATLTAVWAGTAFAAGWEQDGKGWRWQTSDGTYLADTWQWTDGNKDGIAEYYYFGADGYLLTDTATPDQNQVNHDGAWVIGNEVQTMKISLPGGAGPYRKYVGDYHLYMEEYTEDEEAPVLKEDVGDRLQVVEDDGVIYIVTGYSFIDEGTPAITKRIPLSDDGSGQASFEARLNPEYWAHYYAVPKEDPYGHHGLFIAEAFERYEFWYIKE